MGLLCLGIFIHRFNQKKGGRDKASIPGQAFGLWLKLPVETPVSHIGMLIFGTWLQLLTPTSCQYRSWETAVMAQVIGIQPPMGDLDSVASSWLWPQPAPGVTGIGGVNQWIGACVPSKLLPPLSHSLFSLPVCQINK